MWHILFNFKIIFAQFLSCIFKSKCISDRVGDEIEVFDGCLLVIVVWQLHSGGSVPETEQEKHKSIEQPSQTIKALASISFKSQTQIF